MWMNKVCLDTYSSFACIYQDVNPYLLLYLHALTSC